MKIDLHAPTAHPSTVLPIGTIHRLVWLAALTCSSAASAQATLNIAPRISLQGVSEMIRAETLCASIAAQTTLTFGGLAVTDADIGGADMHARIELEPAAASTASVAIPGLSGLPGITIIREEPDRIRFNGPLSTVNAAFAALEYRQAADGDMIDIIADDLQLPPLSAEFRLHVETVPGPSDPFFVSCRPPPDLQADSDTGSSSDDDITSAPVLYFDVAGVQPGDTVQLLNDDVLVNEAIADAESIVLTDDAPVFGLTALYSISVNGDLGSAAWSVALIDAGIFVDGFESTPP